MFTGKSAPNFAEAVECVRLAAAFGDVGWFDSAGKPGALHTLREVAGYALER
jgi:hypothetical protein